MLEIVLWIEIDSVPAFVSFTSKNLSGCLGSNKRLHPRRLHIIS